MSKKTTGGASVPRFVSREMWNEIMLARTFREYDEKQVVQELEGVVVQAIEHTPKTYLGVSETNSNRKRTESERVLNKTELGNVWVQYKTGPRISARVKYSPNRRDVWLEPIEPNRASIVMEEKDLLLDIDLSKTPHLRVYHTPKNNEALREWFYE